jgi:hypothetical protein
MRERIADENINDRYDVILASFTYHQWDWDRAVPFTQLYYNMARPHGGILLIHEFIRPDEIPVDQYRGWPWYGRVGLMGRFESWTVANLKRHLESLGWVGVSVVRISRWGSTFVTALKP